MLIHKVNQAGIWTGESSEAAGCPPGWVATDAAPTSGQVFSGGAWLTLPDGYVAPAAAVVLPTVVTMRQARLALLNAGLLAQVDTFFNNANQGARIEWEYATEISRDHTLVDALTLSLSLTDEQIDQLFIQAVNL